MKKLKLGKIPAWISGGGVLFLSSACLFAVGFSAWTFGGSINGSGDLTVRADDVDNVLIYKSKSGSATFSKYGFVVGGELVNSYTFVYDFTFKQAIAKSANIITNNEVNFSVLASNGSDASNFIYMVKNGYVSSDVFFTYNGADTAKTAMTFANNSLSCSAKLSGVTDTETETVRLHFGMTYTTDNAKLNTLARYFSGLPINTDFSFSIGLEAIKTV